eukprot:1343426-Amorphochlora_amoeboformis.AAC.1
MHKEDENEGKKAELVVFYFGQWAHICHMLRIKRAPSYLPSPPSPPEPPDASTKAPNSKTN